MNRHCPDACNRDQHATLHLSRRWPATLAPRLPYIHPVLLQLAGHDLEGYTLQLTGATVEVECLAGQRLPEVGTSGALRLFLPAGEARAEARVLAVHETEGILLLEITRLQGNGVVLLASQLRSPAA